MAICMFLGHRKMYDATLYKEVSRAVCDIAERHRSVTYLFHNLSHGAFYAACYRAALGAKFARAKNTAQTRGAVRSQVILELEGKVAAEIISGYGEVTAQALESDPTVCLVTFSFTVAQGLNQIWLSAQITV